MHERLVAVICGEPFFVWKQRFTVDLRVTDQVQTSDDLGNTDGTPAPSHFQNICCRVQIPSSVLTYFELAQPEMTRLAGPNQGSRVRYPAPSRSSQPPRTATFSDFLRKNVAM